MGRSQALSTHSFNVKYWMEKYYNEMADIERTFSIDLTPTCRLISEFSGSSAEIAFRAYLSKYELVSRKIEQPRSWLGFGKRPDPITVETKRYLPTTMVLNSFICLSYRHTSSYIVL